MGKKLQKRSLGISSPEGEDVHEFMITVKSKPSVLGKLSSVFGDNNCDILASFAQVSDDRKIGYIIIYAELKDSSLNAQELVKILEQKDFVLEVKEEQKKEFFFESFMFPITSGGHYRVVALGSEEWANLVTSLTRTFGSAASSLLFQEGLAIGKEMIRRIKFRFTAEPRKDILLKNFCLLFRATGLGILKLEETEKGYSATVEFPVVSGKSDAVDHLSIGIVTGGISAVESKEFSAKEILQENERISFILVPSQ